MRKYMLPYAVAIPVALAMGAVGFLSAPGKTARAQAVSTLTVQGQATVNLTPNQAVLNLGDVANAKTAAQAMAQSNAITQAIIHRLEADGVAAKDIQTSGLNVNPNYGQGSATASPPITGYQVNDSLTVTVNQISLVGRLIDAAMASGANQINGVTFSVTNVSIGYQQAYAEAIKDAESQAQAVLTPLGEKILGVKSVSLNNNSGVVLPLNGQIFASAEPAHTPVMPGQTQFSAHVTVVYRIGR